MSIVDAMFILSLCLSCLGGSILIKRGEICRTIHVQQYQPNYQHIAVQRRPKGLMSAYQGASGASTIPFLTVMTIPKDGAHGVISNAKISGAAMSSTPLL